MSIKKYLIAFFLLVVVHGVAQLPKRTTYTKFTTEKITIDAKPNEQAWNSVVAAKDFLIQNPDNGKPEPQERKSEVKLIYDHEAVYVFATLYDSKPETIKKELTTRDDFATADHFGVFINGYNDGQQEFRFFVSSAGVQQDCVYTETNGEDFTWNAIYETKVEITSFGWVVEMKIPYAAIRFPKTEKQTWGVNFYRESRDLRHQYNWNLISNEITNEATQTGILEGIENIDTPIRLFLIPYVSQYFNANNDSKTKGEFKGGLDIKYGINDAFTLDAILVPDFGQAKFDNVVLNLGPFEQIFNENRPFFTEGTELFNKGNLVYSRRIGGEPSTFPETSVDEEIVENPGKVNLLNALKLSGRTKSGVGIGILNAVTERTTASVRNTITNETRDVVTEPLANYNVFVVDKRFNQNSSVTLINTNVTRNGEFRDANVSAVVLDLNTKKNTFNLTGDYKFSYINEYGFQPNKTGYNSSLYLKRTKGKYLYGLGAQYVSTNWDNNDLGVNFQNHYHTVYFNQVYRILKSTKKLNQFNFQHNTYSEFENRTGRLQNLNSSVGFNFITKKNDYIGFGFGSRPLETYDFYEPRSENNERFLTIPKTFRSWIFISSNYNRKFAFDINPFINFYDQDKRYDMEIMLSPRYRLNDRTSFVYEFYFQKQLNNLGYVGQDDSINEIYIGQRDRTTYSNTLSGKYTINELMNINLALRYYWSYAIHNSYYTLQNDGSLNLKPDYTTNQDRNFSTWNLDLTYSWWFAPGSQLTFLYRNNAFSSERGMDINRNFRDNLNINLNNEKLNHILSMSIRYFIDYNSLKKATPKK
jgi:hypothetical protein